MARKTLLKACTGINNRLSPHRLRQYDRETGVSDLSAAVNVDIDETGQPSRRLGQVEISSISSHSLFCDGGDAFVVQDRTSDSAIYRINSDFTLTGVASALTKGEFVSFAQVGSEMTLFTNGYENGLITNGVESVWPVGVYHGPDTLKDFSQAPVGTKVAYHRGRAWVAVGKVIYCSEPYKLGLFRLARCFYHFGTDVLMIRPVEGGVWVSDSETTGFISVADKWDDNKYSRKAVVPAHEWSDACSLVDLSRSALNLKGLNAVWSSDEGLCVGTPDGQLIVVTEDKLIYPTGSAGATVVSDQIAINSVY